MFEVQKTGIIVQTLGWSVLLSISRCSPVVFQFYSPLWLALTHSLKGGGNQEWKWCHSKPLTLLPLFLQLSLLPKLQQDPLRLKSEDKWDCICFAPKKCVSVLSPLSGALMIVDTETGVLWDLNSILHDVGVFGHPVTSQLLFGKFLARSW